MHGGCRPTLNLAVGIATKGRPAMAQTIVAWLEAQTRVPDAVLIAAPSRADICGISDENVGTGVTWIPSPIGLTKQRNRILREASGFDIVVFFDDDFLPQPTYLAEIEQLFLTHPDVVLATGHVIADGIIGPGLRVDEAQQYLEADRRTDRSRRDLLPVYNGYGCNMAVRMSAVRRGGCLFDELLPLYGWLEDVDFSRRLGELGRVVLSAASRGVHLGVKSGRELRCSTWLLANRQSHLSRAQRNLCMASGDVADGPQRGDEFGVLHMPGAVRRSGWTSAWKCNCDEGSRFRSIAPRAHSYAVIVAKVCSACKHSSLNGAGSRMRETNIRSAI